MGERGESRGVKERGGRGWRNKREGREVDKEEGGGERKKIQRRKIGR